MSEDVELPMDPSRSSPDPSRLPDIMAVIESAKARGGIESLQRFIAKALPDAKEGEIVEAAEVALEVIESIPVFIARARQEGESRSVSSLVLPLMDHAERYYLQPLDVIPEMTQGLAGLLDDSYLVIRIIEHLDKGPEPFLDWDLEYPAKFLARLMGPTATQQLDLIARQAMVEVSTQLAEFWATISHPA